MKRTVTVPAGIGDNIWLLMKLVNTGEKFHFILPDGHPQRGKQIFDLVPSVSASAKYGPGLSYKRIARGNIQRVRNYWKKVREGEIYLSMNEHLENGKRIESFFPDLQTSFTLPLQTSEEQKERALSYTPDGLKLKYVGIYGSSYSTSRSWGFWQEEKWFELIKRINDEFDGIAFVIIGAEWDLDLNNKLMELIKQHNEKNDRTIAFKSSVGEDLGTVVEILRRLHAFIGFPSGLSILNEVIPGRATIMFYPEHLRLMMNAWAKPERIENGDYLALPFLEPDAAFNAMQYLIHEPVVEQLPPPPDKLEEPTNKTVVEKKVVIDKPEPPNSQPAIPGLIKKTDNKKDSNDRTRGR